MDRRAFIFGLGLALVAAPASAGIIQRNARARRLRAEQRARREREEMKGWPVEKGTYRLPWQGDDCKPAYDPLKKYDPLQRC